MYYQIPILLKKACGNNALHLQQRKLLGSSGSLRIPPLVSQSRDTWTSHHHDFAYEYVDEKGRLMSGYGSENLLHMKVGTKDIFVVDNHNHAFAMRRRSFLAGSLVWGTKVLHIDQHSDLNSPSMNFGNYLAMKGLDYVSQNISTMSNYDLQAQEELLVQVDHYTNEVLTIADFILAGQDCGLINSYDMFLTEYKLSHTQITSFQALREKSIIVDIDLDFRAPEMGIEHYDHTISQVRTLMSLPQVGCITIATSPTYLDPKFVPKLLQDLLWNTYGQ